MIELSRRGMLTPLSPGYGLITFALRNTLTLLISEAVETAKQYRGNTYTLASATPSPPPHYKAMSR